MPFYNDLRPAKDFEERDFERVRPDMTQKEKLRTIEGLGRLKDQLAGLPKRRTEQNLIVASWNIVALGAGTYRTGESLYYLAEIMSCFDLIAVQEQRSSLTDLDKILRIMGPNWKYMVTDPMGGTKGNEERSAYVFNTDRVQLSGVSGELSVWKELLEEGSDVLLYFDRPPNITGFRAGWKEFAMINVHLHPGNKSAKPDADPPRIADAEKRRKEIASILGILDDRKAKLWTENLVLVGDMNFYKDDDADTIKTITDLGYVECDGLEGKTTNIVVRDSDAEAYDRMFFSSDDYFRMAVGEDGKQVGGVLNPFKSVYRDEDLDTYRPVMAGKRDKQADKDAMENDDAKAWRYYRDTFRKRQLSDHFPIYVELEIDDSATFLERSAKGLMSED